MQDSKIKLNLKVRLLFIILSVLPENYELKKEVDLKTEGKSDDDISEVEMTVSKLLETVTILGEQKESDFNEINTDLKNILVSKIQQMMGKGNENEAAIGGFVYQHLQLRQTQIENRMAERVRLGKSLIGQ